MKIAIASDHAGFRYKALLADHLREHGHEVADFGTFSPEPVDYPDFIGPAAAAVAAGRCERGVVLGGSGNGEAMVANRCRGVRCALCWSEESARLARSHNDANMISMGERLVPEQTALRIVDVWLATPFEGGRHAARIGKIDSARPLMGSAATAGFGLVQIGQIAVPVADIDRAVAFYRDTLGMRFLFQAPPGLGFFDCAGVRLMLDAPAKAQSGSCSSVIYYKVADLQVAFDTLSARGVAFERKPHLVARLPDHELWMAFFHDPDRNLLALMSEVAPRAGKS